MFFIIFIYLNFFPTSSNVYLSFATYPDSCKAYYRGIAAYAYTTLGLNIVPLYYCFPKPFISLGYALQSARLMHRNLFYTFWRLISGVWVGFELR